MSKKLIIESCLGCTHHKTVWRGPTHDACLMCEKKHRFIPMDAAPIPDWCPLDDEQVWRDDAPTDHGVYIVKCKSGYVTILQYNTEHGWSDSGMGYGHWNGVVDFWQEYPR